jgi:hypothetical protein
MLARSTQHRRRSSTSPIRTTDGQSLDDAVIDEIIAAAPGLVVIDEAYQPFPAAATSTGFRATAMCC